MSPSSRQERLAALGIHVRALDVPDADMEEQHRLLSEVARMVDRRHHPHDRSGKSWGHHAANLRRAHAMIESGRTRGKIVLEGF